MRRLDRFGKDSSKGSPATAWGRARRIQEINRFARENDRSLYLGGRATLKE
jgi:hypothetical protein